MLKFSQSRAGLESHLTLEYFCYNNVMLQQRGEKAVQPGRAKKAGTPGLKDRGKGQRKWDSGQK
jgi:hypothetical protein